MKKLLVLLMFVVACSSSNSPNAHFPAPDLELGQAAEAGDFLYSSGPISLRYALQVTNNADEQLTLRRVELRTIGGGLYQLPLRSQNVELIVAPHSTATAQFTMWGTANGSMRQHVAEPTTLRGVAYFESAAGPMQKLFTTTIDLAGR
jgi:hypothetical protein